MNNQPSLQLFEVPVAYRGQCTYIVVARSAERAREMAEEQFKDGDMPANTGNAWKEIEQVGKAVAIKVEPAV